MKHHIVPVLEALDELWMKHDLVPTSDAQLTFETRQGILRIVFDSRWGYLMARGGDA